MEIHSHIQKDIYDQGSLNIARSIKSIRENARLIDGSVYMKYDTARPENFLQTLY